MMFDELFYVQEARSILDGGGVSHIAHPPLSKLFIAAGVVLFGDNPFGWRIFGVLCGVASILMFYLICQQLTSRRYLPLAATAVFAFENMAFVQSGTAMLDVYSFTFMLASFLFYLRHRYVTSGVFLSLAFLGKMPGIFGALAIVVYWLIKRRQSEGYWGIIRLLAVALILILLLLPFFDLLATGELQSPIAHIQLMISGSSSLTTSITHHPAICTPWEWLYFPKFMLYSGDPPSYQCAVSWNLWIFIVPLTVYMLYRLKKYGIRNKENEIALFSLLWFASTYGLLVAMELVSNRAMYLFYFYPSVGAICLMAGFTLAKLWQWRVGENKRRVGAFLAVAWMCVHLLMFVALYPPVWALVILLLYPQYA
jgi:predicted membrane-bound dolichyl-phosphate-mannose-protein mannosyltransferase